MYVYFVFGNHPLSISLCTILHSHSMQTFLEQVANKWKTYTRRQSQTSSTIQTTSTSTFLAEKHAKTRLNFKRACQVFQKTYRSIWLGQYKKFLGQVGNTRKMHINLQLQTCQQLPMTHFQMRNKPRPERTKNENGCVWLDQYNTGNESIMYTIKSPRHRKSLHYHFLTWKHAN